MTAQSNGRTRRHGPRTLLLLSAGLVAGATSHALLVQPTKAGNAHSATSVRAAGPAAQAQESPQSVAGVPAGFPRTREGAVAAAANFVCTGQALLDMDPLGAEEAVRQMAAAAAADDQVRITMAGLRRTREALAEGSGAVVFRQAAIAFRLEAWSPQRARVAVWNVGVLSRDGIAPPQAGWAVSTFDLVWERADWKVWGETISPGPAPVLNDSVAPATSAQLASALDGFTDFGGHR